MIVIQGFSDDLGRAGKGRWRKGWDSNPRYPCRHAGFQDRCLKPLGHPSVFRIQGLSRDVPGTKEATAARLLPKRGCVADYGASPQLFPRPGGAPGLYIPMSELTGGYAIGCDIR